MSTASMIVMGIMLLIGVLGAWIYRGRVIKAPVPIITLALVVSLGFYVIQHDRSIQAQKRRDDCVARVERSIGTRAMWQDIGAYLSSKGLTNAAAVVQTSLDKELPVLSVDDCPKA